jgi:hypothetical protein
MKKNLIAVLALGMFSINPYAQQNSYPKITALQNDPQKWQLVQGIYNVIVSTPITSKLSEDEVMKKLDKVIPILLEKSSTTAKQDIEVMEMLDTKVRDGVMTRARANQLYEEYKSNR